MIVFLNELYDQLARLKGLKGFGVFLVIVTLFSMIPEIRGRQVVPVSGTARKNRNRRYSERKPFTHEGLFGFIAALPLFCKRLTHGESPGI